MKSSQSCLIKLREFLKIGRASNLHHLYHVAQEYPQKKIKNLEYIYNKKDKF